MLPVANLTNWELVTRRRRPRVAIDSDQLGMRFADMNDASYIVAHVNADQHNLPMNETLRKQHRMHPMMQQIIGFTSHLEGKAFLK